ncbi:COP9 signalosome complex subunit 7b [Coemansia spiralis]|nr:COP9 signalosome complex subunit 7b [Coemansia spiralis]
MEAHLAALGAAAQADVPSIIERVLEDDSIFHFGRLLQSPKVAELATSDQYASHERLLKLFAFGVLGDYRAHVEQFPQLSAQQLSKLKCLTLVSLASETKVLDYDDLVRELDCASEQEMEDLVVEAIYKGLVSAKLDQTRRVVEIDFVLGRDVRLEDLPSMHARLDEWSDACQSALAETARHIEVASDAAKAKNLDSREFTKVLQSLRVACGATSVSEPSAPGGIDRTDSQYSSAEYQREEQRTRAEEL